ncbi:MAG: RnfABCDGE type electron transport complex subunit D [Planctomycetota bacterium]|nr:RnfABCDGE type electron transport complex subunit D [Planctomycetota bacterium]
MEQEQKFIVSSSPHIRDVESIPKIMWTVVLFLAPAAVAGCYFFGWDRFNRTFSFRPVLVVLGAILVAVATEAAMLHLRKQPLRRALDGSAVITGLLFAMVVSPAVPWYVVVFGSFIAIAVGKQLFGGLGHNIWNPALVGRAFVTLAWAEPMTRWWVEPLNPAYATVQAASAATPLSAVSLSKEVSFSIKNLFWGYVPGCLGETSAIMLLLGGIFLIIFKYADWRVPLTYIASTVLLCMAIPYKNAPQWFKSLPWYEEMAFYAFSGGLFLGAFFMATDMVTSPITPKGRFIFALGCGILTALIRKLGGYPEGVCYSILIMNTCVPLIDRFTKPARFGLSTLKAQRQKQSQAKAA